MDDPLVRPRCERPGHALPAPAETWSPVFRRWLCHDCLNRLSGIESQQTPGALLDFSGR